MRKTGPKWLVGVLHFRISESWSMLWRMLLNGVLTHLKQTSGCALWTVYIIRFSRRKPCWSTGWRRLLEARSGPKDGLFKQAIQLFPPLTLTLCYFS